MRGKIKLPLAIGLGHLCLVIILAIAIATSSDGVAVNAWLLMIPIDFPVSLGLFSLSICLDDVVVIDAFDASGSYSVLLDFFNFWLPALYFGIVGSLWWYGLAKLFVFLKSRLS